jgi:hypothetical protein
MPPHEIFELLRLIQKWRVLKKMRRVEEEVVPWIEGDIRNRELVADQVFLFREDAIEDGENTDCL